MSDKSIYFPYKDNASLRKRITPIFIVISIIFFIFSSMGSGSFIFMPALVVLYLLIYWFGAEEYPPVLLFALGFQWLQISLKPLYAVISIQELTDLTKFDEHVELAYYLSCGTLLMMSYGIYVMVKKVKLNRSQVKAYISQLDTRKLMISYLGFSFLTALLVSLRFSIPGLFQAFVALEYIKWALFFITFYISIKQGAYRLLLYAIIIFEFILGFASYFSEFKTILFMVLIGYFTLFTLTKKRILILSIAVFAMGFLGVVWTAVKSEYRVYLNQDTNRQVVNVSTSDALNYLSTNISELDGYTLQIGFEQFIDRISYIEYFSSCIAYVPEYVPHEDGKLTRAAITHVLVPRLFYPDKPPIDDSKHLTKYSGVQYATGKQGASIALGYAGDLYIDYGPYWMLFAALIFGIFIGFIIRGVYKTSLNTIWGMAMMVPIFLIIKEFDNALIKVVGRLIVFLIVAFLFNRYASPIINKFLQQRS